MTEATREYNTCNLNVFLVNETIEVTHCGDGTWFVHVHDRESDDVIWKSHGWHDRIVALQTALSALEHGEVSNVTPD